MNTSQLTDMNIRMFTKYEQGETVIDLGSGGGIDVFLAAKRVGPDGKAIGIDMTKVSWSKEQNGLALASINQHPLISCG